MSNIDLLLDGELNNGEIVLEIDEYNRAIIYDGDLLLGVKGDYKAEKVIFRSPTILSNGINLSLDNVKLYINYENANGDVYIHRCTKGKPYGQIGSQSIEFYWELSSNVTLEAGTVRFMVCAKEFNSDNIITNEWHTAIFSGKVLDALNVDNHTQVTDPDLSTSINDLRLEVNSLYDKISDLSNNGFTLDDVYNRLTNHTHNPDSIPYVNPSDSTKDNLKLTLDHIYTQLGLLSGQTGQVINVYTKTEVDNELSKKANATHNHNSGEIYYPNTSSENKKDLKTTLDDIYSKLNNKTDVGHNQSSDSVFYNSKTVTYALNDISKNKANISDVENTYLKKESFSDLYEHNMNIAYAGTLNPDGSFKSIKAIASFKIISSQANPYTKNDIFGSLRDEIFGTRWSDLDYSYHYVTASGVLIITNNGFMVITGVGYRYDEYVDVNGVLAFKFIRTSGTSNADYNIESDNYGSITTKDLNKLSLTDNVRKITKI